MDGKIGSYIGFCIKKGAVIYGLDALEVMNKRVYLVLASCSIGKNTRKSLIRFLEKKNVSAFITVTESLEDVCHRSCKVIGITDKGLAEAIINKISENLDKDFTTITEVKPIDDSK